MTSTGDATPNEVDSAAVGASEPNGKPASKLLSRHPWQASIVLVLLVLFGAALVAKLTGTNEINPPDDGPRAGAACEGDIRNEREYRHEGEVVATSRVRFDASTGEACAKFTKAETHEELYNVTSYLGVTLCNAQGQCDSDRHYYPREAGPVRVSSGPEDCLDLEVSQLSENRRQWLVEPATQRVCLGERD